MLIKLGYLVISIGGLTLAQIDPVLAFFYAIAGLLLILYVQARAMRKKTRKEFVRTISEFRVLDNNLKVQAYIGFYLVISSLVGLLIKIGVLMYAL